MPRFIEGQDCYQFALLPKSLDDFIEGDNAMRVVDAFGGELDLQAPGFAGVQPSICAAGKPGQDHRSVVVGGDSP